MKKKFKKIMGWVGATALIVFLVALGIYVYNFISSNNITILAVSGAVVILFLIIGVLSARKVKKKLKRWLKSFG